MSVYVSRGYGSPVPPPSLLEYQEDRHQRESMSLPAATTQSLPRMRLCWRGSLIEHTRGHTVSGSLMRWVCGCVGVGCVCLGGWMDVWVVDIMCIKNIVT